MKKIENPEVVIFRSGVLERAYRRTGKQIRSQNSAGKVSVESISGAHCSRERGEEHGDGEIRRTNGRARPAIGTGACSSSRRTRTVPASRRVELPVTSESARHTQRAAEHTGEHACVQVNARSTLRAAAPSARSDADRYRIRYRHARDANRAASGARRAVSAERSP